MALNLVLAEDGVLGGVVSALSAQGSHILALRKSEPTLEDVFVALVGRGFDDTGAEVPTSGGDDRPPT
jgi:ABC-2 type transport system ATP-binding protein